MKEEFVRKCFNSLKYVIHYANVRFFFLISLQTYSLSLNGVNVCPALSDSFCTTRWIFSSQIASQLSQVYSHTIFLI